MLKEFIQLYIKEETRYKKETGIDIPNWREKLADYEKAGGYFVHFTDYESPWVYPNNEFDTPTGFYCYPLNFSKMSDFATEQRYAIICKPKSSARILQLSTYSEDQYKQDLEKIKKINEERFDGLVDDGFVQVWEYEARIQTPGGRIWNTTRMYASEYVSRWAMLLYKILGYDGIDDDAGEGIIHSNEPHQAVFFNTTKLDILDILDKGASENLQAIIRKDFLGLDLSGQGSIGHILRRQGLRGAIFSKANLQGVDFSYAVLGDASFQKTNLSGANLRGANLRGANLRGANLRGANLMSAKLERADFRRADLFKADFRGADLFKADFRGADLTGADFANAHYSDTTKFPPGFDLTGLFKV